MGQAQLTGMGLIERERARRVNLVTEAEQNREEGLAAYEKGAYETALQLFYSALQSLPLGQVTEALRQEIISDICVTTVLVSQKYRKVGRIDLSRQILEYALELSPEYSPLQKEWTLLMNPKVTNPALTSRYVDAGEEIERLLGKGKGYFKLGQFDAAEREFRLILEVTPYHKEARKWLEKCAKTKAEHYKAAYLESRERLLMEVDRAWEISVPQKSSKAGQFYQSAPQGEERSKQILEKLKQIVIPSVYFEDATVEEVVDFLRMRSRELDVQERDPNQRGINFIVRSGIIEKSSSFGDELLSEEGVGEVSNPSSASVPQLKLRNIPMIEVLQTLCDLAKLRYRVDSYAVTILPLHSMDPSELITRSWNVTPTFLSDLGGGVTQEEEEEEDPFAFGIDKRSSKLGSSQSVQELLSHSGVGFENGAKAHFLPTSSTLIVKNTVDNLDLISTIVERVNQQTPKQIKITTRFVEISQENGKELGFDWALNTSGSGSFLYGGSQGNGQNKSDLVRGGRPFTSGLRSGDAAITRDSIDFLINNSNRSSQSILNAPAIFSVGGILSKNALELVLRGLSQNKGVDVMTAPSIVARSGETAKIEVIREFIYPTEYDPPEVPDSVNSDGVFPVTPATPSAFETRNTGVTLEIKPTTGHDNDYVINLEFAPEIVEFEGFINYGSPITGTNVEGGQVVITENRIEMPVFSTRRVKTSLTIYDGHTVAVGGLIREDVQRVKDKVPILGDIPLLGRFFRSESENRIKSNLILFVTAQVIDATGKPIRDSNSPPPSS